MKYSRIGSIAVILVMIAVAIAGCSSTGPAASTGSAPSGTSGPAAPAGSQASGSTDSGLVSGSQLLGGLNYEWTEYKITSTAGGEKVSMFFKYNQKTGKCTMRIEGMEDQSGMLSNLDCSSSGSAESASDPNNVGSDVKFSKMGTESVTVPAGTFLADKYMASSGGVTTYYWIASDKPLLRMEGSSAEGAVTTELAGWG